MFSQLKSKGQKEEQNRNIFLDKVATGIVNQCIQAQVKWAAYMQRITDGLSATAKKHSLVIFCLLSLGCSLYIIFESVTGNTKKDLNVAPIRMPVHSTKTGEENTLSYTLITKAEAERIKQFHQYMDSLSRSASGRRIGDSLLSLRPGLIDSIRVIENLYRLQNPIK